MKNTKQAFIHALAGIAMLNVGILLAALFVWPVINLVTPIFGWFAIPYWAVVIVLHAIATLLGLIILAGMAIQAKKEADRH